MRRSAMATLVVAAFEISQCAADEAVGVGFGDVIGID